MTWSMWPAGLSWVEGTVGVPCSGDADALSERLLVVGELTGTTRPGFRLQGICGNRFGAHCGLFGSGGNG